jgi:ribosomal protein S18 acetylase RimI-like enzyme
MQIQRDAWLSAVFGYEVFRVELGGNAGHDGKLAARITEHLAARHRATAMYYAKVDAKQIEAVRWLSAIGFYVVDVNVTFELSTKSPQCVTRPVAVSRCSVRQISTAQEEKEVLEVAASCFRYSRFHLDPLIPAAIADRVKHDWVLSYVRKQRGHQLAAAFVDGQVAGFVAVLASETEGRRKRTIDLIGVNPTFQKQGVGQALMNYFIETNRNQCDDLRVGTQAANLPSMRLYQKFGFTITATSYVLHLHQRNA